MCSLSKNFAKIFENSKTLGIVPRHQGDPAGPVRAHAGPPIDRGASCPESGASPPRSNAGPCDPLAGADLAAGPGVGRAGLQAASRQGRASDQGRPAATGMPRDVLRTRSGTIPIDFEC